MTSCISSSFLCTNNFSGPAGYLDQAISERVNAPIANTLEANLDLPGSIIAGVVCTALKIVSVLLSTFIFLATLPYYCIALDSDDENKFIEPPLEQIEEDDLIQPLLESPRPVASPKGDNGYIFSGPETIVNPCQEIERGIKWVENEIRKKRNDDVAIEFNRLEKFAYFDPGKIKKLNREVHPYTKPGFLRVYAEAFTIMAIFKKKHYAFLHAQSDRLCVIPYLIKEIVKRENLQDKTHFNTHKIQLLRDPKNSLPKEGLYPFLQKEKSEGTMGSFNFDHQYHVQSRLLSVDANPFNIDVLDSAAYYCSKNSNVYSDQTKTIGNIFKAHFNLDDATVAALARKIDSVSNLLDKVLPGHRCGNLFLYLIPKEDVCNYAYLSRRFGVPYSMLEPDFSASTLISLEHDMNNPGKVNQNLDFSSDSMQSSSQYRIYIPALQEAMKSGDLAKRPIVYFITATPEKIRKEMKGQIRGIVDMAEAAALKS